MLKFNRNKLLLILIQIYLIVFLFSFMVIRGVYFEDIYLLNIFSIINLVWVVYSSKKVFGNYSSIYTIVFIFAYLFSFAQVFVFCFDLTDNIYINQVFRLYSHDTIIKSVYFVLYSLMFLHLGAISFVNKQAKEIYIFTSSSLKPIKTTAKLLLIITIIPTLIYDVTLIVTNLSFGYLAIFDSPINNGFFDDFARIFKVALVFLMVGNINDKKKYKLIFVFSITYSLIKMFLIGQRGYEIAFIAALVILNMNFGDYHIKASKLIKYAFLTIILLKFTYVVSEVRGMSLQFLSFEIILEKFNDNSFFVNQISELGTSLGTVCSFFEHVPKDISFGYGMSYLKSWLTVFPNLNIVGLQDIYEGYNPTLLLSQYYSALGGSFFGEFYYNFGYLGVLFPWFIGILISKISLVAKKPINLVFKIVITSMIIWMIRDTFSYLPRFFLFNIGFPYLIYRFIRMRNSDQFVVKEVSIR